MRFQINLHLRAPPLPPPDSFFLGSWPPASISGLRTPLACDNRTQLQQATAPRMEDGSSPTSGKRKDVDDVLLEDVPGTKRLKRLLTQESDLKVCCANKDVHCCCCWRKLPILPHAEGRAQQSTGLCRTRSLLGCMVRRCLLAPDKLSTVGGVAQCRFDRVIPNSAATSGFFAKDGFTNSNRAPSSSLPLNSASRHAMYCCSCTQQ